MDAVVSFSERKFFFKFVLFRASSVLCHRSISADEIAEGLPEVTLND